MEIKVPNNLNQLTFSDFCRLFPDAPAIDCTTWFKGAGSDNLFGASYSTTSAEVYKNGRHSSKIPPAPPIERLALSHNHYTIDITSFRIQTDSRDTLFQSETTTPYRSRSFHQGSVLFASDNLSDEQLFIVKLAPHSADQLHYPGYDFSIQNQEISVHGIGVAIGEINKTDWVRGYGYAIGITQKGRAKGIRALRQYTKQLRLFRPERDAMILSNTWGDRSRDSRMNAAFIQTEVQAAEEIGITHVQLDDGWQAGLSKNSAFDGSKKSWVEWTRNDWKAHEGRFPEGLKAISQKAIEAEIQIGFWFNPIRTGRLCQLGARCRYSN